MNLFNNFTFHYIEEKESEKFKVYNKWFATGMLSDTPEGVDKMGLATEFEKGITHLINTSIMVTGIDYNTILFPLIYRVYTRLNKPIDILRLTQIYENLHITNFNDLNLFNIDAEAHLVATSADEYIRRYQDI